jgi:hypothetical protein
LHVGNELALSTLRRVTANRSKTTLMAAIAIASSMSACAPSITRGGGYCAPPTTASLALYDEDAPLPQGASRDAQLASLLGLRDANSEGAAMPSDARARVVERVALATLAIDATSAELECESERAVEAADYVTRKQTYDVQGLTIGSIAAATITGVLSVLLSTHNASSTTQDTTAISGGAVTGGLGIATFFVHPQMRFDHPRNLLTDVWRGARVSTTYPAIVWAYLSRPAFSNKGDAGIREKIVKRWVTLHEVQDGDAPLLFGTGGTYDADALRERAALLNDVKTEVELAHQDILAFAARLLR